MSFSQIVIAFIGGGIALIGFGISILLDDTPPFQDWVGPALMIAGVSLVGVLSIWFLGSLLFDRLRNA